MSRCQDCEEGRCECGLPGGCEACCFTGVCTTCNGMYRVDAAPPREPLAFPHLPITISGMRPRARGMMKKCLAQRRRLAKSQMQAVVMPNLLELRRQNPKTGSCSLCNRYHTSGTAREHTDSNSAAYQRGVARFRNSEWCPQCFRPFNQNLRRPYAKIGPPPWE